MRYANANRSMLFTTVALWTKFCGHASTISKKIFLKSIFLIFPFVTIVSGIHPLGAIQKGFTASYSDGIVTLDAESSQNGPTYYWYKWNTSSSQWEDIGRGRRIERSQDTVPTNAPVPSQSLSGLRYRLKRVDLQGREEIFERWVYRTPSGSKANTILNVSVHASELPLNLSLRMPMRVNNNPDNEYNLVTGTLDPETYPNLTEAFPKLLMERPGDLEASATYEWVSVSATASNKWVNTTYIVNEEINPNISIGNYGGQCDYHNGEDWNLKWGGNSELTRDGHDVDSGLFAIGEGVVLYADYNSPKEDPVDGSRTCETGRTYATLGVLYRIIDVESGLEDYIVGEYWHAMNILVKPGQLVHIRDRLADVGRCDTDFAHLHFQVMKSSMLDLRSEHIILKNRADYWPPAVHGCSSETFIEENYHHPSVFIEKYGYAPLVTDILALKNGPAGRELKVSGANLSLGSGIPPTVLVYPGNNQSYTNPIAGVELIGFSSNSVSLLLPPENGNLLEASISIVVDNGYKRSPSHGFPFHDVHTGTWFEPHVVRLWSKNVVNGRRPRFFEPGAEVNRAEFVKMLVQAMEKAGIFPLSFAEIPESSAIREYWYYPFLKWAYNYNNRNHSGESLLYWSLNQIKEPSFWGVSLTREEAAHLLMNVRQLATSSPSCSGAEATNCVPVFADVPPEAPESGWIYSCREAGIFNGYPDNTFKPRRNINRSEAAKIVETALF